MDTIWRGYTMKVTTSKSKNSESFYITQFYIDSNGKSTSKRIRKLGTLKALSEALGTDRDGVMAWAEEQARLETEKYKKGRRPGLSWFPFMSTGRWIMTARNFIKATIFSCSPSIMGLASSRSAERYANGISSSKT